MGGVTSIQSYSHPLKVRLTVIQKVYFMSLITGDSEIHHQLWMESDDKNGLHANAVFQKIVKLLKEGRSENSLCNRTGKLITKEKSALN